MPADLPKEGESIPSVDPDDLRRRWNIKAPGTCEASQAERSDGVNHWAVSRRDGMIRMLGHFNQGQLLAPWRRGEELDDAVFQIAATFPIRVWQHRVYKIAGDELYGFDPNAFVEKLIAETGISHTWVPIPTRVPEGTYVFSFMRVTLKDKATPDPRRPFVDEGEARHHAREVLWDAWSKYFQLQPSERIDKEMHARSVANLFADFVIDNADLAQQLIAAFMGHGESAELFAILIELEQRAKGWKS